mmetsp:Transcript_6156/g.21640  ORF Transcript_6156/g.21640 Transcript_6156/m.21640 type:complete len:356 (-) Transcript_6156:151-1218(-)
MMSGTHAITTRVSFQPLVNATMSPKTHVAALFIARLTLSLNAPFTSLASPSMRAASTPLLFSGRSNHATSLRRIFSKSSVLMRLVRRVACTAFAVCAAVVLMKEATPRKKNTRHHSLAPSSRSSFSLYSVVVMLLSARANTGKTQPATAAKNMERKKMWRSGLPSFHSRPMDTSTGPCCSLWASSDASTVMPSSAAATFFSVDLRPSAERRASRDMRGEESALSCVTPPLAPAAAIRLSALACALSCMDTSEAYAPFLARSSACLPFSTSSPRAMTHMLSAPTIVLSLCAIAIDVRPTMSLSSASCTTFSLSLSSALVASSSSRMRGFFSTALAMATRCFCPPLSWIPRSPTSVS